jgi:hypothetical protein
VNSAAIKKSSGFGFTSWFGLSETLTSQLSALTTSDSDAVSGAISETQTSQISAPITSSESGSGTGSASEILTSQVSALITASGFDATSGSVSQMSTSLVDFGASSKTAGSAVILETGSEIDDQASSSSASVAVGAEDGTEGFEGTAVFGHSPVFAGSGGGFEWTGLLKDSAVFGASSSDSSSAAFTASATLSKKAAAQTTSAATWTVAGIGLLFLVVLAAVLVWFFVFHRRTEETAPSGPGEEDPGVTTTEITMEEVEGDFENLNPLASSDGEALFTIALHGE